MTTFATIPTHGHPVPLGSGGASQGATERCNIGPGELRRRRDAAIAAAAALGAGLLAVATGLLPPWTAPWLAPLVGAAVITFLQFRMRFCAGFGLAGLVGMGDQPGAMPVDSALRSAHRRRAALMVATAAGITLGWVVVAGWLVLNLD